MKKDSFREFTWLLQHIESVVPCSDCRQHIEEYRKIHGLPTVSSTNLWMWKFHEAVNNRLGKSGMEFSEMPVPGRGMREMWDDYRGEILMFVQKGTLSGKHLLEFSRHLFLWKGFSGI